MGIARVMTRVKAKRVCGLDASTKSLAFAIVQDNTLQVHGEIYFKGSSVFERMKDARKKVRLLVSTGIFDGVDFIVIESAIMVRNVQVAIDMAYMFGAILSELSEVSKELHKVAPITWQSAIGVPNLKAAEKAAIQAEFPGKSKTWYQNKGREIRKQRIADFSKSKRGQSDEVSDNVTDAIGIAAYADVALTRRT